jgi:hypothetical protein
MTRNQWTDERLERVRRLIRDLYRVVAELNAEFVSEGRKFTPDGHLVGSLGEVLAAYAFNLELLPPSTGVHDAKTDDEKFVRVKLTGGRAGVSLYEKAEYLLVLQLQKDQIRLIYNGEEILCWLSAEIARRTVKGESVSALLSALTEVHLGSLNKFASSRRFVVEACRRVR